MIGSRHGRLTVLAITGDRDGRVRCRCDCGSIIERDRRKIVRGHVRSCGCLKRDLTSRRRRIHGESHTSAGATKLFHVWCGMRQRTSNPNAPMWAYYGARGIGICADWDDYTVFRDWAHENGYREGLTIDRIDVNGNYEPANCRWATSAVQNRNKTSNITITYQGKTACLKDHAVELGLDYDAVRARIQKLGWSVEKALGTPVRSCRRKEELAL